ncbi:MAG: DUF1127 domain-containing protein [Bradyrhizobium sp.]
MPPQKTNLGAFPDASIAALRDAVPEDASSEKQAAGPPVASTRNVPGLLQRCWRALRNRRPRATSLHDLSDRELMDIGLTPGEIDYIDAGRAIERLRDGTAYLWQSRGVI